MYFQRYLKIQKKNKGNSDKLFLNPWNLQDNNLKFSEIQKMLKIETLNPASAKLESVLIQAGVVREQRIRLKDLVTDYFGNHEMPVELNFTDGRVLQFRFAVYNDKIQGAHAVLIVDDVSIRKNVEDLRNEVEPKWS